MWKKRKVRGNVVEERRVQTCVPLVKFTSSERSRDVRLPAAGGRGRVQLALYFYDAGRACHKPSSIIETESGVWAEQAGALWCRCNGVQAAGHTRHTAHTHRHWHTHTRYLPYSVSDAICMYSSMYTPTSHHPTTPCLLREDHDSARSA